MGKKSCNAILIQYLFVWLGVQQRIRSNIDHLTINKAFSKLWKRQLLLVDPENTSFLPFYYYIKTKLIIKIKVINLLWFFSTSVDWTTNISILNLALDTFYKAWDFWLSGLIIFVVKQEWFFCRLIAFYYNEVN